MMLRIMLVGIVASLGFELPSGNDLSDWTQSGRAWATARLAELTEIQAESARALATLTEAGLEAAEPSKGEASTDLAFQAAADQVAEQMVADLAAAPAPSAEPVVQAEPATPAVELTAPAAEVVAASSAPAATVVVAELDEIVSDEEVDALPADSTPSRSDRIQSAVQMTYQAVNAWAAVLGSADEADTSR